MDVFLVPAGADRHELYCEVAGEAPAEEAEATRSKGRGLMRRFREMVAAAERERHQPASEPPSGWGRRFGRWLLRHVAEAIAEQRLLWHLRHERQAALVHPDDITETQARAVMRAMLARDRDRHRFWLAVDGAVAAITGPLFFFVPGPNLVAYFFIFRFVGHYLAWRGARQGLDAVVWHTRGSGPLAEIRRALRLDGAERDRRVRDAASRLRLQHLAAFVRRTAAP